MESRNLGFWGTVGATIVASLAVAAILAAASWVFGVHHQVWLVVVAVAHWFWGVLTFLVPVPVVVLVLLAGFALYVWWGTVRRKRVERARSVAVAEVLRETNAPAEPAPVTDNEISVVRVLAGADGAWLTLTELARGVALSNLVTEQSIDLLRDRGFLAEGVNPTIGPVCRLSPAGRDYAINSGYARRSSATNPRGLIR